MWPVIDVVVLLLLGWGFFGVAITPRITVAALVLHLVYGFALGRLMDRNEN